MSETKKVDVLAVMDALALQTRHRGGSPSYETIAEARSAVAELIEAFKGYFGPMDDPSIGWCDPKPSHRDIFKCEKCGAEHVDCGLIPHISVCRAVRLREAMIAVLPQKRVHCQCSECKGGVIHTSDCAVHNEPAMQKGSCDCGVSTRIRDAAHELLEALKAVVAVADRRTDEFDLARAAIAKAQGHAHD